VMDAKILEDVTADMRRDTAAGLVKMSCPTGTYPEQWDLPLLREGAAGTLGVEIDAEAWAQEEGIDPGTIEERLIAGAEQHIATKRDGIEKSVLLQSLDHHWKEHLATLDALRSVIHLRAYAQKTPLNEYKQEAFALFERMLGAVREDVTRMLASAQFNMAPPPEFSLGDMRPFHLDPLTGENDAFGAGALPRLSSAPSIQKANYAPGVDPSDPATWGQVGRNAPCPCGSGQKYKHCHGQL